MNKVRLNHVYPEDKNTERKRRTWRKRVRDAMRRGIAPPSPDIRTPPERVVGLPPWMEAKDVDTEGSH